ncbi:MAG: hypothetical protein R3C44_07700 [Chloroflexota bacterium]
MDIQFFDDPHQGPRPREDVRIKQVGLFLYPEARRFAFGVELTPFRERPSIEVTVVNGDGKPAGSLHVIETLTPNFSLQMHLRDKETVNPYKLTTVVYYSTPEEERVDIDRQTIAFDATESGEKLFPFEVD